MPAIVGNGTVVVCHSCDMLTVVTGGSRGLGAECARQLVAQGHDVVLVARDPDRLAATANAIGARGWIAADLGEPLAVRSMIDNLISAYGVPDVALMAHGVMSGKMTKTLRTDGSEWRRVMSINLDSVFSMMQGFGAPMAERRSGRLIVFGACMGRMSDVGNTGGFVPYRVSKAGVHALVRNLAHETGHGARGLLVDVICPGHCRTDMGGSDAPRSVEEGADTAVWLATRNFTAGDVTGVIWEDRAIVPW